MANLQDIVNRSEVGAIKPWTKTTAPAGYVLCDGAAISRTDYADLFAVISTTYGAGNGSTTFNVPQLQGKMPQGYDGNTYNLAGTGGANTVTVAVDVLYVVVVFRLVLQLVVVDFCVVVLVSNIVVLLVSYVVVVLVFLLYVNTVS